MCLEINKTAIRIRAVVEQVGRFAQEAHFGQDPAIRLKPVYKRRIA
jgi:hypothetical protein